MPRIPHLLIALFFFAGGVAHFVMADAFITAMPGYVGYHKELVFISGVFEILGAIGILLPQTRLISAYGLMALIVAVYPANINMALNAGNYKGIPELLLYIRLPLQFLFLWFVWWSVSAERRQHLNS